MEEDAFSFRKTASMSAATGAAKHIASSQIGLVAISLVRYETRNEAAAVDIKAATVIPASHLPDDTVFCLPGFSCCPSSHSLTAVTSTLVFLLDLR
jgi:hypothetical protein